MKRVLFALVVLVTLTGCASLRAIVPGGVSASDIEWSGVKSGEPISVLGSLDPRASAPAALLSLLGQGDPLGVFLPVTLIGESTPRWVFCDQRLEQKCRQIPLNAKVHFAGSSLGVVWRPSRLTADDFND